MLDTVIADVGLIFFKWLAMGKVHASKFYNIPYAISVSDTSFFSHNF